MNNNLFFLQKIFYGFLIEMQHLIYNNIKMAPKLFRSHLIISN